MTRVPPFVCAVLTCTLLLAPAGADDPPKKLTADERKELEARRDKLNAAGAAAYRSGKYADAIKAHEGELEVVRALYDKALFPDGHTEVANCLNNLGVLYEHVNRPAAAEAMYVDALAMRRRLIKGDDAAVAQSLSHLGLIYRLRGKYAAAEPLLTDALAMTRRLHPGDHPEVAVAVNNLGTLYFLWGKFTAAEAPFLESLAMRRRLFKAPHFAVAQSLNNLAVLDQRRGQFVTAEAHPAAALDVARQLFKGDNLYLAQAMNNLGSLYQEQGKFAAAEPLHEDALAMLRRLSKGDHPDGGEGLIHLGTLRCRQGRYAEADALYGEALAMRKRVFGGDHPGVATVLNLLGLLYQATGNFADAERPLSDALAIRRRAYGGDHLEIAQCLNNLGLAYGDQGKYEVAERSFTGALAMYMRLFDGDRPDVVGGTTNLGQLYRAWGRHADAAKHLRAALAMHHRIVVAFARDKGEGETLTYIQRLPITSASYLSNEIGRGGDLVSAYPLIWSDKGLLERVSSRRQHQARAATNPAAAKLLAELTDARKRRAELLYAPATKDPETLKQRKAEIEGYEKLIATNARDLKPLLPAVERFDTLAAATPADLQKALPDDAAVVDYLRFLHFGQDPKKPGKAGETRTPRYLAFVVTKDTVAWVDLGTAADIEPAVGAWRDAVTGGKEIPDAIPARVRALVWEKVRKELPAAVKTVYVCPDAHLCRVPFAALPGDKPGTVLLEDYALATIPHAPFLLDKLLPQDEPTGAPAGVLAVGGVKYDAAAPPAPGAPAPGAPAKGGAPVGADEKRVWGFLPNTVGELNGVVETAARKKLPPVRVEGEKATPAAVLAALPKAKVAHLATHGFFADAKFRSALQLDERDYEMRGGERVGRAAVSPLVMTGLVFAGANDPKTPGRGIVTGEQLIDLDLSGLELAVLSACETGVGDVAGGQGTFGLQRAFHYAGARNVVCSLWKVPDAPTAALMGLFYQNLWDKGLTPMESLRQAQLEVYRNPGKIPELAKGFRGVFEETDGAKVEAKVAGGKAHPLLWAAFTLSGPGK